MKRIIMAVVIGLFFLNSHGFALKRPSVEFKIFQFPRNIIPCIDGKTDDWDMVPKSYVIGADELMDTVKDHGLNRDPKDLDVSVRVGWVKGTNQLYFLYEADDDYWNMYYARGDIFEVVVDGDLSGGQLVTNPQLDRRDNYYKFHGVHAQNYHIFTPPGEGRDWAMVWGCQPWIRELPFANYAYNYNFKEGESGHLALEFFITPFDFAPFEGPEQAVISKLDENKIIGLSWSVLDYDENPKEYEGFWNLSHETMMYGDASCLVAFRLMPLEPQYKKPIEAEWAFKILNKEQRIVAFKDLSQGEITSWLWDFADGTTSTERHPMHTYKNPGDYNVILTVEGPAGKAKRIKIFDVVVY